MMEIYVMMGGIVAFVTIIAMMDLSARRQQRRLRQPQPPAPNA